MTLTSTSLIKSSLLNFQQQGSGDHLILIHGLFGSLENLNMVAKGLVENYRVTNIDVRNHGASFHQNNMDYNELAQDVINVLDHLGIDKTHILGHSMGGKIAMQTALLFPQRINKLIVADIAPVEYPPHHQQILAGLQAINLSSLTSRKEADKQLQPYVELNSTRQFLLRNLTSNNGKFSFKCNLANITECYRQIMQGYSGEQIFNGETLFIKGGNSDYILAKYQAQIAAILPNSRAKIIQGAGHWLHAEKTIAFNKIVNDFLVR